MGSIFGSISQSPNKQLPCGTKFHVLCFVFIKKSSTLGCVHNMEEQICHNLKPSKICPQLRALQVPYVLGTEDSSSVQCLLYFKIVRLIQCYLPYFAI